MKKLFALVTFVVAMSANAACDLGPTIPGTGGPMNCYEPGYPIAVHNTSSSSSANANAAATANSSANANSTQANVQNTTVTGDTITYQAQERNPVSTAYAAPLAASNGTCLGSSSGGVQGAAFGLSFGTTVLDPGCDTRYDAQALYSQGLKQAAIARLCMKPEIAEAMKLAGTPCK